VDTTKLQIAEYSTGLHPWQERYAGSLELNLIFGRLEGSYAVREFLKGWAKNLSGKYIKEKERLLSIIDSLDLKAEKQPLNVVEREALNKANDSIRKLRRDEETKWAQRAKVKHIQEGGNNTRYFHLIANGKHRKKKFFQLEQQEGTIVGQENLKIYITEFYKKLFGPPESTNVSLMEDYVHDIPQLSSEENVILTSPFTEKEVCDAISEMVYNKAPGPDGFPAEFYQMFWGVIKSDIMALFDQLVSGDLPCTN
jgi:hypothetical protein